MPTLQTVTDAHQHRLWRSQSQATLMFVGEAPAPMKTLRAALSLARGPNSDEDDDSIDLKAGRFTSPTS